MDNASAALSDFSRALVLAKRMPKEANISATLADLHYNRAVCLQCLDAPREALREMGVAESLAPKRYRKEHVKLQRTIEVSGDRATAAQSFCAHVNGAVRAAGRGGGG
jgi:hypothetical protein